MYKTKTVTQYSFRVDDVFTVNIGLVIRTDGTLRKCTNTHITNNIIRGAYKNQWRRDNPELNRRQRARYRSKRKNWGEPEPINDYFDNSHLHHMHIDGDHCISIYIPISLHIALPHRWYDEDSMLQINQAALIWYYFIFSISIASLISKSHQ